MTKSTPKNVEDSEVIPLQAVNDQVLAAEEDLDGSINSKRRTQRFNGVVAGVKDNWRKMGAVTCLWLAYTTCNAAYSLFAPFLPKEVVDRKGFSSAWTGLIVGCAPLTVAIFSPVFGYFLTHHGLKFMVTMGLLIIGSSYILLGFSDLLPSNNPIFLLYTVSLRLIEGIGTAIFITAIFTALPTLFPNSLATLMGLFEVGAGLGYALGPPLGGFLYELGGFTVPFFSIGALILIFVVPGNLLVEGKSVSERPSVPLRVILAMFSNLVFILLVMVTIVAFAFLGFFTPNFEPFLSEQFNLDTTIIGFVFFDAPMAYFITAFFAGPLSDTLGVERWFIVFGLVGVSLCFVFVGPAEFIGSPTLWLTILSFTLMGIAAAFAFVPVYADILATVKKLAKSSDATDETALTGFVAGLMTSSISIGEFLGPVVGGSLTEFYTFQTSAFLFSEVILAQALVLMGATIIEKYTKPEPHFHDSTS